jgi:hypothetical protein
MFLLFDARCHRCSNHFRAEADTGAEVPPNGRYRYECPRCYTLSTSLADDGLPCPTPTPWAVRATITTVSVRTAESGGSRVSTPFP